MIIIWRRWGWLVLAFFLLTWWLADNVVGPIYTNITGLEGRYNADKAICWAIALVFVAALMFAFWYFLLRMEGVPLTTEEWTKHKVRAAKWIQESEGSRLPSDPTTEQQLARLEAEPIPAPTKTSTFFFIPFKFMPIVFVAIAILLLVVNVPVALDEAVGR